MRRLLFIALALALVLACSAASAAVIKDFTYTPLDHAVELEFTSVVCSKPQSAIVDITEVSFIASLGMRMLLSAAKNLRAKNFKVVLYNPQPVVQEALETAGFSTVMPIVSDFAKALEEIGR